MQSYIVTGGFGPRGRLASTEILKKEGGTSWQKAASLPSATFLISGVSLPNGHFLVTGEDCSISFYETSMHHCRWIGQRATSERRIGLWSWCRQVDQGGPDGQGPYYACHEPRAQGDCWLLCLITWHCIAALHCSLWLRIIDAMSFKNIWIIHLSSDNYLLWELGRLKTIVYIFSIKMYI